LVGVCRSIETYCALQRHRNAQFIQLSDKVYPVAKHACIAMKVHGALFQWLPSVVNARANKMAPRAKTP